MLTMCLLKYVAMKIGLNIDHIGVEEIGDGWAGGQGRVKGGVGGR